MPQVGTLESLIVNNAPGLQDCTNLWFLQLGTCQIRFNGLATAFYSLQIIFDLLYTFDILTIVFSDITLQ